MNTARYNIQEKEPKRTKKEKPDNTWKRNSPESRVKARARRIKNSECFCLQEILLELMDERKVSLADIQRSTNISWSTLYEFYKGQSTCMLNQNILKLSRFFNVSIHYLAFGIGDDSPVFDIEAEANKSESA